MYINPIFQARSPQFSQDSITYPTPSSTSVQPSTGITSTSRYYSSTITTKSLSVSRVRTSTSSTIPGRCTSTIKDSFESTGKVNPGVIIGPVVGVVVLAIIATIIFAIRRIRSDRKASSSNLTSPQSAQNPNGASGIPTLNTRETDPHMISPYITPYLPPKSDTISNPPVTERAPRPGPNDSGIAVPPTCEDTVGRVIRGLP